MTKDDELLPIEQALTRIGELSGCNPVFERDVGRFRLDGTSRVEYPYDPAGTISFNLAHISNFLAKSKDVAYEGHAAFCKEVCEAYERFRMPKPLGYDKSPVSLYLDNPAVDSRTFESKEVKSIARSV